MRSITIEHTSLTDIGLVREANEDSCGAIEGVNGPVFTVCDGMGGHVGGAIASGIAVKSILDFITTATVENPSVSINNAIISANQKILEAVRERPDLKGMGTTATILTVQPGGVYIGHVGDSRIYMFTNGQLHRLTKDHSFVQTLLDAGAITPEEADTHPRKNELTNAMGVLDAIQPTVIRSPIKPRPGDIFLLCTDGLCGLVNDTTIEQIVATTPTLDKAAQQLIQVAKSAGGYDNITVQLIKVIDSPYNRSVFESFSPQHQSENPPANMTSPPKKGFIPTLLGKASNKSILMICLVLFVIATVAWYFFKPPPVPDPSAEDSNPPTESASAFLPGDTIIGNYLVHSIATNKETLDKLTGERKKITNKPYKQFNFDSTYANDGVTRVDQKTLGNYNTIKWKKKEDTVAVVDKITVQADQVATGNPAPDDPQNNTRPVTNATAAQKDSLLLVRKTDSLILIKAHIADTELQKKIVTDSLEKKKAHSAKKDAGVIKLDAKLLDLRNKQKELEKQVAALNKKIN
jgi:serine/threonine protein phosphatase PrpC